MRVPSVFPAMLILVVVSLAAAVPPAVAQTGGGGGGPGMTATPVRFGQVVSCSEARAWREFLPKGTFRPGERLCLYVETLQTVHNAQIDLEFHFYVMDPEGDEVNYQSVRFTREATGSNWAAWQFFPIPDDADLGAYSFRVDAVDHLAGRMGSAAGRFSIVSADTPIPPAERPQLTRRTEADVTSRRRSPEPEEVEQAQRLLRVERVSPADDDDEEEIDANNPDASEEPLSPEIEEGNLLLRRRKYEDALKVFKRAEKKEKANPTRAYWGQARAYSGLGAYKNVVQVCEKLAASTENPRLQALAHNQRGVALIALADQRDSEPSKKKELPLAEQAFRTSLELEPRLGIAHFNLGVALLKQEKDEEGIVFLREFLEGAPRSLSREEAERYIENPRRAREPFAPEFTAVTVEGEYVDLSDLRGKVVLVDFWATWCPPCVESVPALRNIHKRYSKEPFVLVSISVDSDEAAWRQMIAKEKMNWHQVRDGRGELARLFKVQPIPTYLVIDGEGIIRMRQSGWGVFSGAELESSIKKHLKTLAKMNAKST